MKLSVLERIILLQVLPTEGTYITFQILISLKKSLSFTEKEIKEFGISEKEGRVTWGKTEDKEIEIGEKATEIIVGSFKKLDKDGKINEQNINLYEKFIKT